jgi:tetratricopeptide (TPR) repeat protein
MMRLIFILVLLPALAVAQPADSKAQAAAVYASGQTAYQAKDYANAAAKFTEAYELDPDPVYLFNAAQAYRFDNDCKHAMDYYRQFLDKVPSAPNRDKVRGWLAEATKCVEDHALPEPPPVESRPQPAPAAPDHTLAYATGAGGLVLIAAGAFFTHVVYKIAGEHDARLLLECSPGMPCGPMDAQNLDHHFQDRADAAVTKEIVSYTLGAVALAASTFLYVRAGRHHDEVLSIAPTGGGAMVVGGLRF